MQMVGADWIRSNQRENDLGSRPGGLVQVCSIVNNHLYKLNRNTARKQAQTFNLIRSEICRARGTRIFLHC